MTRQIVVEGQLFQVDYCIEDSMPTIYSVHAMDQGVITGPNLVSFLDPMYYREGDMMMPVLSIVAHDIMLKEMH